MNFDMRKWLTIRPDIYMPRTFGGAEYFQLNGEMIVSSFLWKELVNVHTWPEWCQSVFWRVT